VEQTLALNSLTIAVFLILGAVFVAFVFAANWLVSPHDPTPEKLTTYECGNEPIGLAWIQFRVGYYVYALLFVIFDVETVFLYPWAAAFGKLGAFIFIEMILFVAILFAGLLYAWKEGALRWR
jgi:NADH-quinone oxidoreductase subunit A